VGGRAAARVTSARRIVWRVLVDDLLGVIKGDMYVWRTWDFIFMTVWSAYSLSCLALWRFLGGFQLSKVLLVK
jgi:hypothetical protein